MNAKVDLAAELHRAFEGARTARAAVRDDAAAAVRALENHDATTPEPFDEAAAAAILAQAEFADRAGGGRAADAVRERQAAEREARAAEVASHASKRAELAETAERLAAQVQAADAAIADLERSRRAAVADAAAQRLEAELEVYRGHVQALVAGAQRILALRTIAREPERDARQARQFEGVAIVAPAFGAFDGADERLRAAGVVFDGGNVRCTPERMAEGARDQFGAITDALCGVRS